VVYSQVIFLIFFSYIGPSTSRKRPTVNSKTVRKSKKLRLNAVNSFGFTEVASSHNRKIIWYYAKNIENLTRYPSFLDSIKYELVEKLREHVYVHPIKFNLKLESTYSIPHADNSAEDRAFKTSARPLFTDTDIEKTVNEEFSCLLMEEDTYMGRGSGFSLEKIDGLFLAVYHYTPLGGSSYIPLPTFISSKKAVINPQNADELCFKWAILAKHVTGENKHRIGENYLEHENKYDFTGLTFPTPLNQIKIFEKKNNVSVNVYGLKKEFQPPRKYPTYEVYPLKVVDDDKQVHFDILIVTNGENIHYTYILNFSRLVRSQKTLHRGTLYICKRCFTGFDDRPKKFKLRGQAALDEHKLICGSHKPVLPVMPHEGETTHFESWGKTERHPVAIYADFEALLEKCHVSKGINTHVFQKHKCMSYSLYVKTTDDVSTELLNEFEIEHMLILDRGCETREEVAKYFVETVVDLSRKIDKLLKTNIPIIMTDDDRKSHVTSTNCNLCKTFFSVNNVKVADHNHLSGRFRQTLCNNCNIKVQTPNFVSCFLHNLTNYDAHFIIKELGYDDYEIKVIPNSEEKYISFSKYINNTFHIRFIDTYRFMASSLATLASNLLTDNFSKFRETAKVFKVEDLALVTRKGVYPYEYMDSWGKLQETSLPRKEEFYNTLKECDIDDEDYDHARMVWDHFDCQTLGEYSDLYLKIDVMLLVDVFENFRDICLTTYNLDPAFYYTAPGFSFDCMLKYTKMKLELLTEYDMLLMFEKGIYIYISLFIYF
jgi:hypothetical protein